MPLRAILIAIVIHSLWGGNPVAVKLSLEVFPPLWTAFFRFAIAIVCVSAWALAARVPIWPRPGEWPALAAIGALFTIQIAAMNVGFDLTSGAMGAILISTNPLFAALFAHFLIPGDRLHGVKAAGLMLAFAGTGIVLTRGADLQSIGFDNVGNLVVLASACLLGGRLILTARVLQKVDEVRVIIWQMLISLPLFGLGGLAFETIAWENLGWRPLAGIAYQGLVVAGLGFTVSFYLMKRYAPSVMVSFNFVSPIAGVLLSAWLLGDVVGKGLAAGMALVAVGLYLIARR